MCAQKSTSPTGSAAGEDETLQRQHAALKRAYSKLQVAHWEKEQVIEQRDGEIARLKAALDAAKRSAGAAPAAPKDRADAGSSSLLLSTEGGAAPGSAPAEPPRAQAPVPAPAASDAGDASEAASPPQPPGRRNRGRGAGRRRVRRAPDAQEVAKFCDGFFRRFQVNSHDTLQDRLAEFLIARNPNVNTEKKRRETINQAKFKADLFMKLLWFDPPGTPKPYRPGNVDEFFHFFIKKTDHDDMGKLPSHIYANHVHRVAHWMTPDRVTTHAEFTDKANQTDVLRARRSLTGVNAIYGLYRIWKGDANWPDAARNPVGVVTPMSKAPVRHAPCAKRPAPRRKPAEAFDDDDDDDDASDDDEDDSSEDEWSCADHSDDCDDGGGRPTRAKRARNATCDSERELARLFESIEQGGG